MTGIPRSCRNAAEPLATEVDSMIPKTSSVSTRARAAARLAAVCDSSSRQVYVIFRPFIPPALFTTPRRASTPARKGRKSDATFPVSGYSSPSLIWSLVTPGSRQSTAAAGPVDAFRASQARSMTVIPMHRPAMAMAGRPYPRRAGGLLSRDPAAIRRTPPN